MKKLSVKEKKSYKGTSAERLKLIVNIDTSMKMKYLHVIITMWKR